ncbi:ACP phosphodiesterase [Alteromonas gracilis]|uniref:acyl carrier protein phosphodiesterase n=1 Tax=Alteromonas gracilis TaxID=1479524 RepID=UPI003735F5A6
MNYLAHLFLARPTADSHFGNLLGDFRRGVDVNSYSSAVLLGLKNHYEVDKFTDSHESVREAKTLFDKSRRRFAPVALDIYFDHLLIKHWDKFTTQDFGDFREQSFSLLEQRLPTMPRTMQHSVGHMITHDWFEDYAKEEGIAKAISVVAKRIRFTNTFHRAVDDIRDHKQEIEKSFLAFFPDLITHVKKYSPEK